MGGSNRCQFFTQKWANQLRAGLVLERFTGQAERGYAKTNEAKLNFHFNASLAALNLLRLEDRQQAVEGTGRNVISIASWKTRKFTAHLLERFSCQLGLDFTAIKSSLGFAALCNYGAIAA